MKESVVVFFFANSNHISNVETLHSIYKQDYEKICLIICNDATYGFENERLLANFEERKGENIQQILFQENLYPLGEFECQKRYWNRMEAGYYFVIHSGEVLSSETALTQCVEALRQDPSADAVLADAELWSDGFGSCLAVNQGIDPKLPIPVLTAEEAKHIRREGIRDCMLFYRLPALRTVRLQLAQRQTHIGQHLMMRLLRGGSRVLVLSAGLCRYTEGGTKNPDLQIPAEFGSETIRNIENILREQPQEQLREQPLFGSTISAQKPTNRRNIHHMLYKLSTFSRVRTYAVLALLLIIAAGLFLNLDMVYAKLLGGVFAVGALGACGLSAFMLLCNLFYKRYPQRLVVHD